jgi:trimeric autotransporter adhesin
MSDSIILTPQTFIASQKDGTFAAYAENLQLQRDDAIAAKTAAETDRDAKVAAANAALAAANTAHAAALAAKDADKQAALDAAKTASDAAAATAKAEAQTAADAAGARIAALTASVTKLTADCAASLAAQPVGSLSDTLTPLEALYFQFDLAMANAKIGEDNAAAAARNATKKPGEPLEPLTAPISAEDYFRSLVSSQVATLGTPQAKAAIAQQASAKLLTLPEQVQAATLTKLGLAWAAAIPADQRHAALIDATPAIIAKLEAMDPAVRDGLIVQVMMS